MLQIILPRGSVQRRVAAKAWFQLREWCTGVRVFEVPAHLRSNWRTLSEDRSRALTDAVTKYFATCPFVQSVSDYLSTEDGARDLRNHLFDRSNMDRELVVPWLESAHALRTARILEIGCGTGASTVALAEQGASVIGVDVNGHALEAARTRFDLYELSAEFVAASGTEIAERFAGCTFDVIVFFAVLEHMTIPERLAALQGAWSLLPPGGVLAVVECPNRLWYIDDHTSLLPFFHWLPDDLAIQYAVRSPREHFEFPDVSDETRFSLMRWGRGVSYHEFELAMGIPADSLPVTSCLEGFYRGMTGTERIKKRTLAGRYEQLLQEVQPRIHRAFGYAYLNLTLTKPQTVTKASAHDQMPIKVSER